MNGVIGLLAARRRRQRAALTVATDSGLIMWAGQVVKRLAAGLWEVL